MWSVDYDSILYENKMRRARTCWLYRQKDTGILKVKMVEGFQIEPPIGFRGPGP